MEFNLKAMLTKSDTKNKYMFWDVDGTLAPYRFNGHLCDPDGSKYGLSFKEIEEGIFLKRLPSKNMQHIIKTSNAKAHIVMGHALNEKEISDKHIWLDKHFPLIKEKLITFESKPKSETIINYCKENKINIKDVIYVDDIIAYIQDAEKNGITAYHISSLLDWDYLE